MSLQLHFQLCTSLQHLQISVISIFANSALGSCAVLWWGCFGSLVDIGLNCALSLGFMDG